MNSQVSNMMSIDDHVDKINEAKNKVQNGIFEMAEAITEAVNQLDGRQAELSEKLGMSKGTVSKWVSIGSNRRLVKMKDKAPSNKFLIPGFRTLETPRMVNNVATG